MAKAYLIHGAYGGPDENWFPWLRSCLEQRGHEVITPSFPTPEGQSLSAWFDIFESHVPGLDESAVLVGHSLGPVFIANILNKYEVHVAGSIFVAGFRALLGNPDFDEINSTFVEEPLDFQRVGNRGGTVIAYVSENDPYVPLKDALEFAENVGARIVRVPNAGHFNAAAGYSEFPSVLDDCLALLDSFS